MTFAIHTFGCKVNIYESEYVTNLLLENNFKMVDFNEKADIYIISTCTVTNEADKKDRKLIHTTRNNHKDKILVVMGCYSQLNPSEIDADIILKATMVDGVYDSDPKKNLNAKVSSSLPLTYMSNNTSIAIVDAKGNVTGKTKGTTSIVVKQSGNNLYKSTSKTVTVTGKEKSGGTDSKNTYTVVFNPNGGKGSTSPQKIEVGKYEQLNANKFTRDGYEFVGWATSSNKQVISGTDVTKFKNVDMKHFQLGKVLYKNKAKVKNLANKNTQIVLYAVWKGNGPRAALDWGKLIADDNHFMYNTKKKSNKTFGCYFCGDNKKKGKKVFNGGKHYVCMTFVDACYAHGANCKSFWSSNGTCNGTYIDGNSRISKIKKKARLNTIWYSYNGNKHGKKPSLNSLKPGDILVTQKAKGGHVVMYWGKNSKGEHLMLECTHSSRAKGKSGQIALHNVSKWYSKTCQAVFRFKG